MTGIQYDEPLFRPPAEAYSLIFQVTLGCSWNRCSYCEMYTTKQFRPRKEAEALEEIQQAGMLYRDVHKIFLADGNAMALSAKRLLRIMDAINKAFPQVRRVSTYAMPRDIAAKTDAELKELYEAGLQLVYVGVESGDDEVLKMVNKGETAASTLEGLQKAHEAGFKSSVMVVNGLAGKRYSEQHAVNSAKLVNKIQPRFFSTLILTLPYGESHYRKRFNGEYEPMGVPELLKEMEMLLENTELERTIFRSNHASNFLPLKGTLSRDKEKLLAIMRDVQG
jgi:radical SAM superfamily enzyme YgiQ (UPF0313 family)